MIVVLHTVLERPVARTSGGSSRSSPALADRVVVQSEVARDRLLAAHDARRLPRRRDPARRARQHHRRPARPSRARRPVVLTWGLLGPGKGIEYAIEALAAAARPRAGAAVRRARRDASEHRPASPARPTASRCRRSRRGAGVDDLVEFDDGYRDTAAILAEVREADIVLLPYLSRDQVVSGVLVEAIASAKPVVSTAFPHAVELLAEGSGIVVPHEDPRAMAAALRTLLTDPERGRAAAAVARVQAASLTWENVGATVRASSRAAVRTARSAA